MSDGPLFGISHQNNIGCMPPNRAQCEKLMAFEVPQHQLVSQPAPKHNRVWLTHWIIFNFGTRFRIFFQFWEVKKVTTDVQNDTIISHHCTGNLETSKKLQKKLLPQCKNLHPKEKKGSWKFRKIIYLKNCTLYKNLVHDKFHLQVCENYLH